MENIIVSEVEVRLVTVAKETKSSVATDECKMLILEA